MKSLNITATGDALVMKRFPEKYRKDFSELKDFIEKCDVKITNLETNISDFQHFASSFSGGTWLNTTADVLDDLAKFGFNYFSFANNHTLDYSYGGMFSTLKEFKKRKLNYSGAGTSLTDAAKPSIIKTEKSSVAIISITSSFNDAARAGNATSVIPARPGVNAIRYNVNYYIPESDINHFKEIADKIYINGDITLNKKYGYAIKKNGEFKFGNHIFKNGDYKKETKCNKNDLNRTLTAIKEALKAVDYVFVVIHSHEVLANEFTEPADFIVEFAHKCIDAGASAVIGGGTHQLKPIEIYKGYPIFYSLGNFIYQGKSVKYQPADFYEKYDVPLDYSTEEALNVRSKGDTIGIHKDFYNYMTFLPKMEFNGKKLTKLSLMPVELGFEKDECLNGLPCFATGKWGEKIFKHIQEISKKNSVKMNYVDGYIEVEI